MQTKLLLFILLVNNVSSYAQLQVDSTSNQVHLQSWSATVQKKLSRLQEKLVAKTKRTLHSLQQQEEKISRKRLSTKDSDGARVKLTGIQDKYKELEEILNSASVIPAASRQFIPYLDTLNTAFGLLNETNATTAVKDALSQINSSENKLQQAEQIKNIIRERRDQLTEELKQFGLGKELRKIDKEIYYYSEQIKAYKQMLSDPNKIERKAIELFSKTKPFQDFFRRNSMLASLFRMSEDPNDPNYIASLAVLQTRAQVNSLIQQLVTSGQDGQTQFQQDIRQAQSQLQRVKDKLLKATPFGGGLEEAGGSDDIIAERFNPNNKKRSFLKRLEYGTNFQTQKANNLFPVTSDLGLSVGYKVTDKSVIGIGGSYKLGFGRGWNHIHFTQEGAGLRSYIDWKAPFNSSNGGMFGSFWISAGYEMNYRTAFNSVAQLQNLNKWSQSGLIGLSKVSSISFPLRGRPGAGLFKKTKLQMLWDFLSYQQIPRTQSIVLRVGYNF